MKIIESLQQNTPEWIEFRKNKIGASDALIIMGVSPWSSPMQLWERKIGIAEEQQENSAMSRGKALEDEALQAFSDANFFTTMAPSVVQHESLSWMIASLDGLSLCQEYAVEIKVPGREDHLSALAGVVPPKYIPQLQHQLAVTGLDMIYYYSYDGEQNACIEVLRDQEYIDKLIEEELKFYNCIIKAIPPDLTAQDYWIRNDDRWYQNVTDWLDADKDLKFAQDREQSCRKRLIETSQSKNSKGFGVKVQKIMRQGAVQYSEIECLKGVDLEPYRKPASESWRITLD